MIFRSALILGSTSEIAENICLELASRGCKRFHLISRDPKKNNALIKKLHKMSIKEISTETLNLDKSYENARIVKNYDLYLIAIGYLGDTKS